MTGTELEIVPPLRGEISGSTAERLPEVHAGGRDRRLPGFFVSH